MIEQLLKNRISFKTIILNKDLKGQLKNLQNQVSLPLYLYKLYSKLAAGKSIKPYPDIILPKSILQGNNINLFSSFVSSGNDSDLDITSFQNISKTFSDKSVYFPLFVLIFVMLEQGEKEFLTGKPSEYCLSNTLFLEKITKFNSKNTINNLQGKSMIPYNDGISLKKVIKYYYTINNA